MASGGKRAFDPHTLYDVSAEEMRRVEARRQLRESLKQEFQMKNTNPFRPVGDHLFDPALQRFLSMKVFHYEMFKPTPKTTAVGVFFFVVPIAAAYYFFEWNRERKEKKLRRGEVAYRDRFIKYGG